MNLSIREQYIAIQNTCNAYNCTVQLSTLQFHPYGGYLYNILYPKSGEPCLKTDDVDGYLIICPKGVTLKECLADKESENLKEVTVAAWIEARQKILNKDKFESFLKRASSKTLKLSSSELTFAEEQNTLYEIEPIYFNMYSMTDDLYDYEDPINSAFPLSIINNKKKYAMLDIHFGIMHHYKHFHGSNSNSLEIMWASQDRPLQSKPSIFILTKQFLLLEQLAACINRFVTAIENTVLNPANLEKCLKDSKCRHGVVKAKKTLCRVQILTNEFKDTTVKELLDTHDHDQNWPLSEKSTRSNDYFFTNKLTKSIDNFNKMLQYGFEGSKKYRNIVSGNSRNARHNKTRRVKLKPMPTAKQTNMEIVPEMTCKEVTTLLNFIWHQCQETMIKNKTKEHKPVQTSFSNLEF